MINELESMINSVQVCVDPSVLDLTMKPDVMALIEQERRWPGKHTKGEQQ